MRIVFSRDRPAQLDLLLRSLEQNDPWWGASKTIVIWRASTGAFDDGYMHLPHPLVTKVREKSFDADLRRALDACDEFVAFYCDDDVLYRSIPSDPTMMLRDNPKVLTVSLTRGRENDQRPLPDGFPLWNWQDLPPDNFGYPGGIDGHYFRVEDVREMVREPVNNPNLLETILTLGAEYLANRRPLMACFDQQCAVGVPVNRVSRISRVPAGKTFPQTTEQINERWLRGERISLEHLDTNGVRGVHHEIRFVWERR